MTFPAGGGMPGNGGAPPAPPAAPPGPPVLTGAHMNVRIQHGDPAYPKELWGKTLADALRFYGVMREDFMRRNDPRNAPPPLQGEPAGATPVAWGRPSAPQAPTGYVPPPQAGAPAAGFDPSQLQSMITAAVNAAIAGSPVAHSAADAVHDRMRRTYPDWMAFEDEILKKLAGASASDLTDEGLWRSAYFMVKGEKLSDPNFKLPQPESPPGYQFRTPTGAIRTDPWDGRAPHQAPPAASAPQTPPAAPMSWFTENPGAPPPASGPNGGGDPRNDPAIIARAHRHGIPVDEYIKWLNGSVPAVPADWGR